MTQPPPFWRSLLATLTRNPISFFAVLCVATATWLLYVITDRLLDVLESPQWCAKAIQAEKITPGNTFKGLESCLELLKMQLSALGTGFHIALGAFAFSLVVLIVVVVAGARASGKLPGGLQFDVSRDDPGDSLPVTVVNPPSEPVPTTEAPTLPPMEQKP